ncbi:phage distal tail protein, Rcc01695 family [Primorskyibacter sp. S87]|uniref:phage distal tail protein, Rcc01695 family n=1 Tax=Primorskyibacter sp. S87 TaxID=3415126 RepID=UPI003C7AEA30
MNFHEVRFPANLSFGSVGGPERRTDVVTLANGFEERNTPWAHSRRRYDAGLGMRSLDDVETLIAFFEARRGQMYGFRWKDWSDYKSGRATAEPAFEDQIIGVGDGKKTIFQISKTYRSGEFSYQREITKPVQGTVRIGIEQDQLREAVDYQVDHGTGVVTFEQAPADAMSVSAGFEFDVPVRFDTDRIQTSVASFQAGDVPNVPVVEVRV